MMDTKPTFSNPQVNFYVEDVLAVANFYIQYFGFTEIFRTPSAGMPDHIELKLDAFILGVASRDAAKNVHGVPVGQGAPRAEIVLWTNDVDMVFNKLVEDGIQKISEPHDFLSDLRAAWVYDPAGNPVQIVAKRDLDTSSL